MNEHTDKNTDKNKDKNKESNITSKPTMDLNQADEIMKKTISELFRHGVRTVALLESDNDLVLSYNGISEVAILYLFISFKIRRPADFKAALEQIEDIEEEADINTQASITFSEPTMDFNQAEKLMKETISVLFKHGVRSFALFDSNHEFFLSDNGITAKAITELFIFIQNKKPLDFEYALLHAENIEDEAVTSVDYDSPWRQLRLPVD